MSKSQSNKIEDTEDSTLEKTCFIIMPISDHPDYSPGHFKRVYEYIIKPACEAAGFRTIRADDVKSTNYIALDIVKQIIHCDMAICDLSSKNPNVLYEVGIRQAFNLPVTFLKDKKTNRIFDIQGFRDVPYDETLRIDTVDAAIIELSETLENTYKDKEGINSLISMLGITPAKVTKKEISLDTELILNAIKGIKTENNVNSNSNIAFVSTVQNAKTDRGIKVMTKEELNRLSEGDLLWSRVRGEGLVKSNTEKNLIIDFSGSVKNYKKASAHLYKYLD